MQELGESQHSYKDFTMDGHLRQMTVSKEKSLTRVYLSAFSSFVLFCAAWLIFFFFSFVCIDIYNCICVCAKVRTCHGCNWIGRKFPTMIVYMCLCEQQGLKKSTTDLQLVCIVPVYREEHVSFLQKRQSINAVYLHVIFISPDCE